METTKNVQLAKLGNWTRTNGSRTELILIILAALAITLRYFNNSFAGVLLILSMSALSIFYYISAYRSIDEDIEGKLKMFANRLGGWGCSIGLIGILFSIKGYEGTNVMLLAGALTSVFATLLGIYIRRKDPDSQIINTAFVTRTMVVAAIAMLLYLTPKQTMIDMNLVKPHTNIVK
jgi:hypothetical protein